MRLMTALVLALMTASASFAGTLESRLWEKVYLKNKNEDACRALNNPNDDFKLIRLNRIKVGMSECAMQLAAKQPGAIVESLDNDKERIKIWRFPVCAFGRMDDRLGVDCYNLTRVTTRDGKIEKIYHED